MATTVDSYSEANKTASFAMDSLDRQGGGQSFTNGLGSDIPLDSCQFYLKKVGSPTGNMTAKLYSYTGTPGTNAKPSGASLASSDVVLASSVSSAAFVLVTFNFTGANRVNLVNGTTYFIVVEYSGGDGSNEIEVGVNNIASPNDDGNSAWLSSGSWNNDANDQCFYVFGLVAATGAPFLLMF